MLSLYTARTNRHAGAHHSTRAGDQSTPLACSDIPPHDRVSSTTTRARAATRGCDSGELIDSRVNTEASSTVITTCSRQLGIKKPSRVRRPSPSPAAARAGPALVSDSWLQPDDRTASSLAHQPPRLRKSFGCTHAATAGPGLNRPGRSLASSAITGSGSATRSGYDTSTSVTRSLFFSASRTCRL